MRQTFVVRVCELVAALFLVGAASPLSTCFAEDTYYRIYCKEQNYKYRFDVRGAAGEGAVIQVTSGEVDQTNRLFRLVPVGDGYYQIRAQHSDLPLAVTKNGDELAEIITSSKASRIDTEFALVPVKGGAEYLIVSRASGRTIDVRGPDIGELSPAQSAGSIKSPPQPNRQFILGPR